MWEWKRGGKRLNGRPGRYHEGEGRRAARGGVFVLVSFPCLFLRSETRVATPSAPRHVGWLAGSPSLVMANHVSLPSRPSYPWPATVQPLQLLPSREQV